MGNQDNWTTPKQIKIEREGEPKGVRRGPGSRKVRKKGVKARMDELRASKSRMVYYAEQLIRDKARTSSYRWGWNEAFDRYQKKHEKLLNAALRDNMIEIVDGWEVEKP